jgi:stearoyl-CoA desaturase (delta-9 desaturase)
MLALIVPYYLLVGLGVTLGYHRGLAHNSVLFRPWFRYVMTLLGLPAGHPVAWAGAHRHHHLHTDEALDPHSPVVSGLAYAHCGWYLQTRSWPRILAYALAGPGRLVYDALWRPIDPQGYSALAKDVASDPFMRFASTRIGYALLASLHLLPCWFTWHWTGGTGLAILYGVHVFLYNVGDAVNSLGHVWGGQRWERKADSSRNNRLLALLTLGDGWHNNHHAFPSSARHGLYPGEWDATWVCVQILARWGWITHVQVAPAQNRQGCNEL